MMVNYYNKNELKLMVYKMVHFIVEIDNYATRRNKLLTMKYSSPTQHLKISISFKEAMNLPTLPTKIFQHYV